MTRKHLLLSGVAAFGLVSVQPAFAQDRSSAVGQDTPDADQPATGAQSSQPSNEIVVTARKVAESLQEVPLAITAFTSEDITERQISELEDVALLTPGLVFEDYSNGGFGTPVIRGATQFSITGLEQNVSVFLDGIYIPRQYAFDIGSMNLERIEVVKGPQSALYGANAFAGAINYISSSRSLTRTSAHVEASVSEHNGFELIGKGNIVAVPDVLSLRIGGGFSKYGGDWRNAHPDANAGINPGTNGRIGGYDKWSVQLGATVKPFDALTVDLDYYHFDTLSETKATHRITRGNSDLNCSPRLIGAATVNLLYCGALPVQPIPGPSKVAGIVIDPRTFGLDSQTDMYRAAALLDITSNVSLAYQFGRISGDVFSAGNADRDALVGSVSGGQTVNVFNLSPAGGFDYDSHEARLQYQGDNGLYLMVGGYLQDGRDVDLTAFYLAPLRGLAPIGSLPAGAVVSNTTTNTKTKAVFGRVEVPFGNLKVSAEARYADEEKEQIAPAGRFVYKDTFFTPRFGIDYQITRDNLLYASVAKGIKAGGINTSTFPGLIAAERFYGPDSNWTYEIGSKNSLMNGRALFNAALFLIDWSNLQLSSTPTGAPANTASIISNIGGAKSKGFEIETSFEVTDAFTVDGGLAYIDATYNEGTISARVTRANLCAANTVCAANGDVGGNKLQRTSSWQWNVGLAYDAPTFGETNLFGRVDVAGQSKQYTDEINTAIIPARTLVNAKLGLKGDFWSASVWAKNLFDKKYVSNALFIANPFQVDYLPSLGNRRRIGATVSFDF